MERIMSAVPIGNSGVSHDCFDDDSNFPIGMAYVPWQKWRKIYEPEVGFARGTQFSELDLPFLGEEVVS